MFCANDVQRRKFFASVNQVITQGKGLSEEILMHVLKTQCVPILVYGCEIWSDKVVELNKVNVCLNKSVRRIFNMKQNESVKYILMFFNMLPANFLVLQKKLILSAKLMSSVNNIENCCGIRCILSLMSGSV